MNKKRQHPFQQIHLSIQSGQHLQALQDLKSFSSSYQRKQLAPEELTQLASFYRRLGYLEEALKILNPIVRPSRGVSRATAAAKTEYAASLVRLRLLREARELMDAKVLSEHPQAHLHWSFSYIVEWDYENAHLHLQKIIQQPKVFSQYEILVTQVNWAMGLVFLDQHAQAQKILLQVLTDSDPQQHQLIRASALEILADSLIENQQYQSAQELLKEAKSSLQDQVTVDEYLVRKQEAILNLKQKGSTAHQQKLLILQKEALDRGFWESYRDCDRQLVKVTKNSEIIRKLIWGTPYSHYQNKIISELSVSDQDLEKDFHFYLHFQLSGAKNNSKITADKKNEYRSFFKIENSENSFTEQHLKQNQLPHRILKALARDLYRPQKIMDIFDSAFPGDYYHPIYSVDKVHQGLKRLRQYLQENQIPLQIKETKGMFQLQSAEPSLQIILPRLRSAVVSALPAPLSLQKKLRHLQSAGHKTITRQEWMEIFKVSSRTASREIQQLEQTQALQRRGQGPQTHYLLRS